MNTPYFQSVYTTYHGPTNTRGSRIHVTMNRGDDKIKSTESYDYAAHDAHDSAVTKFAAANLAGWELVCKADAPKGYVYLYKWIESK